MIHRSQSCQSDNELSDGKVRQTSLKMPLNKCTTKSADQTASPPILLKTCSSAAKPQHMTVSLCVSCVSMSAPTQMKIKISQTAGLAVWLVVLNAEMIAALNKCATKCRDESGAL